MTVSVASLAGVAPPSEVPRTTMWSAFCIAVVPTGVPVTARLAEERLVAPVAPIAAGVPEQRANNNNNNNNNNPLIYIKLNY